MLVRMDLALQQHPGFVENLVFSPCRCLFVLCLWMLLLLASGSGQVTEISPVDIGKAVRTLREGAKRERVEAVVLLAQAAPKDPEVVKVLIEALKDPESYDVRTWAADGLGNIGPFAAAAIDPLIDTLNDSSVTDDSLRNRSAFALGQICGELPPGFLAALEEQRDPFVKRGMILALSWIGPKAADAVPYLIKALDDADDSVDGLYMEAVHTLVKIGPVSTPMLVDTLLNSSSPKARRGAARVLGRLYQKAAGNVPSDVIDALVSNLKYSDDLAASQAAEALGQIASDDQRVIHGLGEVLESHSDEFRRTKAAKALSRLPFQIEVAAPLLAVLAETEPAVRGSAAAALAGFGDPVAQLLSMLYDQSPDSRLGALEAICSFDPPVVELSPMLIQALDEKVPAILITASQGIAKTGGVGLLPALPKLRNLLEHEDQEVRIAAAVAMSRLSPVAIRAGGRRYGVFFHDAANIIPALAPGSADQDTLDREVFPPIRDAAAVLARDNRRVQTIWTGAFGMLLASFAAATAISPSIRRRMRIWLGQRWSIVVGDPDTIVQIIASDNGATVSLVIPGQADAITPMRKVALDRGGISHTEELHWIREKFASGSLVRIEVDESLFSYIWTHQLGSRWGAGKESIIAGQVCFAQQAILRRAPSHKRLTLATLHCPSGPGSPPALNAAGTEVASVFHRFCEWKAGQATEYQKPATRADLQAALRSADIVHVAAHATPSAIFTADAPFTVEELRQCGQDNRCRLLILSACETGRIDQKYSLVAELVRMNVNVLAATSAVGDHICHIFFEEFYSALLPRKRAQGITVGEAIRQAAAGCSKRLGCLEPGITSAGTKTRWEETINSFVLFGDPTIQIKLGPVGN